MELDADGRRLADLRRLVAGAVRAPEDDSPEGASAAELAVLSDRLGRSLPPVLRACPDTGPVGSDRICFRGDGMSGACNVPGASMLELPVRGPDDRDLCRSTDLPGPRYLRLLRRSCAGAVPAGSAAVPGFRGTPQT